MLLTELGMEFVSLLLILAILASAMARGIRCTLLLLVFCLLLADQLL